VPRQRSWLFIPDDPRLRLHAARVAEQRRHSLRRNETDEARHDDVREPDGGEEQMSLFAAISAVATDATGWDDPGRDEVEEAEDDSLDGFELTLAPLPPLAGGGEPAAPGVTRREEKRRLRDENAAVARELVRRARSSHAQVNAELNRLSGVGKVSEATIEQLERRLAAADRWLAKT
jgi:hypothetical protein